MSKPLGKNKQKQKGDYETGIDKKPEIAKFCNSIIFFIWLVRQIDGQLLYFNKF